MGKKLSRILALNVLLLPAALGLGELVSRAFGLPEDLYHRTHPGSFPNRTDIWARADPDVGWVFSGQRTGSFKNPHYRERRVRYRVNAQGFRDHRDFAAPEADSTRAERLLLLGDSFAFGTYIEEAGMLSRRLEERLPEGHRVYCAAIPGWGIDQMLLAYRKLAPGLDPATVVLVYIDDDVPRVYEAYRWGEGLNKPSFRLEDGALVVRTATGPGRLEQLVNGSHLLNRPYRHWWRKRESLAIARACIAELARACEAAGRRLVVVRYPERADLLGRRRNPGFSMEPAVAGTGALYLDPYKHRRRLSEETLRGYYLEHDTHPSPAGNAALAEWLVSAAGLPRRGT